MARFQIVYWASVITILTWLYAALAAAWPWLFNRGVVQHGVREPGGYRIGRALHWRLPRRPALLITLLSGIPLLAAIGLEGWSVTVILMLATVFALGLWLSSPPGMKLSYTERKLDDGQSVFILLSSRQFLPSVITLIVFGVVPALLLGAILSWLINRFSMTQ